MNLYCFLEGPYGSCPPPKPFLKAINSSLGDPLVLPLAQSSPWLTFKQPHGQAVLLSVTPKRNKHCVKRKIDESFCGTYLTHSKKIYDDINYM